MQCRHRNAHCRSGAPQVIQEPYCSREYTAQRLPCSQPKLLSARDFQREVMNKMKYVEDDLTAHRSLLCGDVRIPLSVLMRTEVDDAKKACGAGF